MRLLLTLTLSLLTIWFSEQMALFLFLLAEAALAYLPTALSVALRPLFPFQQAQYDQVFLLKSAPFCKPATSLLLLSNSSSVLNTLWHRGTLFFLAGPVCSSFSAEACAILQALCWSWQHQQVCHFSSLLLLSDSRSVLATLSSSPCFLFTQSLR